MRLHNILLESQVAVQALLTAPAVIDRSVVTTLASMIAQGAKEWMVESQDGRLVFYRGASAHPDHALAFVKGVRSDRVPKDTLEDYHDYLNAMITAVGGTANRSNTAAVTANEGDAGEYGLPYVAIPLGDFSYTWSPIWKDWYEFSGELSFGRAAINLLKPKIANQYLMDPTGAHTSYQKALDALQKGYEAETDPLKRAVIKTQMDRLKRPDKRALHYAQYTTTNQPREVLMNPESYDVDTLHKMIMVDRGLSQAFNKHHEVMIQCNRMLYIVPPLYELVLKAVDGKEITENEMARYATILRREYWPARTPNEEPSW